MSVGSSEFYLECRTIVGHHHGTDLATAQEERLTCFEVLDWQIFQQSHRIMQVNVAIHGSHDITGRQPREVFPMSNNPRT